MKKHSSYVLFIIYLIYAPMHAFPDRDARGNYTENFTHLQVQAKLNLPSISFKETDDIPLNFTIFNTGKEVVRIFPAMNWRESFQLQIRDENNRLIEDNIEPALNPWNPKYQKDKNQQNRNTITNLKGDESKEISLNPGETFAFRIHLQENFNLIPGHKYNVIGYFYPNATESKKNSLLAGNQSEGTLSFLRTENTVSFFYDKRREEPSINTFTENSYAGSAGGISPEEAIFLFLGAESKKNWSNYFKWIEFEDFILAYDQFAGEYLNSDARDRELVVNEFRKYLTTLPSGKLKYFKITGVDHRNKNESKVRVFVERIEERIPTRYEYEYTLKRELESTASLWKIHNVVVRVRK
ncbi:hypothetical protein [Leptospira sp. GIMC2001]|uniref:hypothetical protein n=1 Tax=Leptospira sp. GIMC2001 TaxID=1513297 RepID=UPI002348F8AE|nr:hypothetical protein [Leptospira sp. GIMC2001]WCL47872.1 hypothetical protein O4O04_11095 [Leptospira sp. GIMC2001]